MPLPKPPQAPFELTLHLDAETWDRLMFNFELFAEHVAEHGPECNLGGGGGDVRVRVRDVSPEQYASEVRAWSAECRAARPPQPKEVQP